MKTSVMEVHDMLSVLSVSGVERRIGEVPGVESVTANHAAGTATVRYDETRLNIADIKSAVRQRGNDEDAVPTSSGTGHEGHTASGATTAGPDATAAHPSLAAATPAPIPATARPAAAASAAPVTAAPAGDKKPGQPEPSANQHDAEHRSDTR